MIDKSNIKPPKGTRDFLPQQMVIRRRVFEVITQVFQNHGAVEIDTPVFELRETLMGKYGEEGSKLVYDLQDQGGELLSLRYDLTVPFARFLATHGIKKVKRYHIGKVYRRDQPSINQGRYREFFQCDFDIAGENCPMLPDAELIKIIDDILTRLEFDNYTIKISNRKILDGILEIANVDQSLFKTMCSTIDKLDKSPWDEVEKELIQKGLNKDQTQKIGTIVNINGKPFETIAKVRELNIFQNSKIATEGLNELELMFKYLQMMNGIKHTTLDLALARGLDYYTGMIQETVLHGENVGSISGGGRYDQLVGMFSSNNIPSVGASLGIERIFAILEKKLQDREEFRENQSDVLVATIPSKTIDMNESRFKIYDILWQNNIKTDVYYRESAILKKQFEYAQDQKIPFVVIVAENEIVNNIVNVKYQGEQVAIQLNELADYLKKAIANPKIHLELAVQQNPDKPRGQQQNEKEQQQKESKKENKKENKKQPKLTEEEEQKKKEKLEKKEFYKQKEKEKQAKLQQDTWEQQQEQEQQQQQQQQQQKQATNNQEQPQQVEQQQNIENQGVHPIIAHAKDFVEFRYCNNQVTAALEKYHQEKQQQEQNQQQQQPDKDK